MKPFCAIYSTFLQRAYDQVVHDVAIQSLPVRFAMDRAGYVGADGATHAGSFDLSYLGCLPSMVIMAPSDEAELMHVVATAVAIDDRPSAFRYPRGEGTGVALPTPGEVLAIGKGRILREGNNIAILSLGTRLGDALKAADELAARGFPTTVADARFAKPIDTALVEQLARNHEVLITIEEGVDRRLQRPGDAASGLEGPARLRAEGPADGHAGPVHRPRHARRSSWRRRGCRPRISSRWRCRRWGSKHPQRRDSTKVQSPSR